MLTDSKIDKAYMKIPRLMKLNFPQSHYPIQNQQVSQGFQFQMPNRSNNIPFQQVSSLPSEQISQQQSQGQWQNYQYSYYQPIQSLAQIKQQLELKARTIGQNGLSQNFVSTLRSVTSKSNNNHINQSQQQQEEVIYLKNGEKILQQNLEKNYNQDVGFVEEESIYENEESKGKQTEDLEQKAKNVYFELYKKKLKEKDLEIDKKVQNISEEVKNEKMKSYEAINHALDSEVDKLDVRANKIIDAIKPNKNIINDLQTNIVKLNDELQKQTSANFLIGNQVSELEKMKQQFKYNPEIEQEMKLKQIKKQNDKQFQLLKREQQSKFSQNQQLYDKIDQLMQECNLKQEKTEQEQQVLKYLEENRVGKAINQDDIKEGTLQLDEDEGQEISLDDAQQFEKTLPKNQEIIAPSLQEQKTQNLKQIVTNEKGVQLKKNNYIRKIKEQDKAKNIECKTQLHQTRVKKTNIKEKRKSQSIKVVKNVIENNNFNQKNW